MVDDAGPLAALLAAQRPEYLKDFFPFAFDAKTITETVTNAALDAYWGIYSGGQLAGFCMLRGRDSGYLCPSFGIVVAEAFSGRGLARRALAQALHWCSEQAIGEVMLKVAHDNVAARVIYEDAGFLPQGRCPDTGHAVYTKVLEQT